ncbi:hypothetical protein IE53DRAFT_390661 [Violaceomyces palustris]|uniref:Uncharacterized protein n=1 Tax=Violaceomyces palustris TaxID=1673888 RepID=A0ACD0NN52_9BASI|nr:hypothetical protein IE53DRAFT_390661 [Violaceomyces palustris]
MRDQLEEDEDGVLGRLGAGNDEAEGGLTRFERSTGWPLRPFLLLLPFFPRSILSRNHSSSSKTYSSSSSSVRFFLLLSRIRFPSPSSSSSSSFNFKLATLGFLSLGLLRTPSPLPTASFSFSSSSFLSPHMESSPPLLQR